MLSCALLLVAAAQAAFYGLALLDLCIPQQWPLKRLSSVRTFVVLMAAVFFVPAPGSGSSPGKTAVESGRC